MATTNTRAHLRRWLACALTLFCLPAFALAADCSCLFASIDSVRSSATVCDGAPSDGCCTDCCRSERQDLPSRTPAPRRSPLHGVVGILLGRNLCPTSTPPLPVQRAHLPRGAETVIPVEDDPLLACGASASGPPEISVSGEIPSPPDLRRIILRRCRPGNSPPAS